MENKKSTKALIMGIILFILSLLLTAGVMTFFSACKHKTESGRWMACHWAQMSVFGAGCVMSVISLLTLFIKNARVRLGLVISLIPMAVYTALIPNNLISLCMKTDMQCHSVMKPAVIVISILICIASVISIVLNKNEE